MPVDDVNTVALLHMNGADGSTTFTDESGKVWTANGNAQIDTAQSKFLGACGLFDGTGDYIDTPDSADFDVGSGNFTIDFWIRPAAIDLVCYLCGQASSAGVDSSISWFVRLTALEEIAGGIVTGSTYKIATTNGGAYAANTWYHVALVRNGNTLTLYVDGVAAPGTADVTGVTANHSANKAAIGRLGEFDGLYYNGWIDEFRFSKGIARWTANFTPPTREYAPSADLFLMWAV